MGQILIYFTIKNYGALVFSTVMTTRQFVSVLLSSIIFLNPLTFVQWIGTSIVFGALYYQGLMKARGKKHPPQALPTTVKQEKPSN